ncbi:MAG: PA2778 family cysteine peptidase, partial [Pseudomonadales bacterium]|nr:PA2778 family cysteine peptidase [Pseudomonadales bacterium]
VNVRQNVLRKNDGLAAELRHGRPVLVLQNLGRRWWPIWHYAVVVGIDAAENTVVLRSGAQRRSLQSLRAFTASWDRADRWAMVTLVPGTLPADPDRMRYLTAVAALEDRGEATLAARAYAAWLEGHGEDRAARFGLARAAQAQGDLAQAADAYARLLAEAPKDPVVLNNLALIRADQGCRSEALALLDSIDERALSGDVLRVIAETRRDIEAREGTEDACAASTHP